MHPDAPCVMRACWEGPSLRCVAICYRQSLTLALWHTDPKVRLLALSRACRPSLDSATLIGKCISREPAFHHLRTACRISCAWALHICSLFFRMAWQPKFLGSAYLQATYAVPVCPSHGCGRCWDWEIYTVRVGAHATASYENETARQRTRC